MAAGGPDLRFHDLRPTGAVLAAQEGATLAELQARLGHTTPAAAMIYQNTRPANGTGNWPNDLAIGPLVDLRHSRAAFEFESPSLHQEKAAIDFDGLKMSRIRGAT